MPPPVPPRVKAGRMISGNVPISRRDAPAFLHGVRHAGARHIEADLEHRLLEGQAVFALVNGGGIRADHPHAVPLQHAALVELHGAIQRRLAAERRQQRVRLFARDDLLHHLGRDRLDVRPVGELRVRHDRGRIRVHEDHLVAFLLQRLAGLDAGVVELAPLADDDGAGADEEDFFDGKVAWHGKSCSGREKGKSAWFLAACDRAGQAASARRVLFPAGRPRRARCRLRRDRLLPADRLRQLRLIPRFDPRFGAGTNPGYFSHRHRTGALLPLAAPTSRDCAFSYPRFTPGVGCDGNAAKVEPAAPAPGIYVRSTAPTP